MKLFISILRNIQICDIIHKRKVRRFGANNTARWKSASGKAQQAAGTQPWSQSREVRFKRRQWNTRAAMRKREAIQPRKI